MLPEAWPIIWSIKVTVSSTTSDAAATVSTTGFAITPAHEAIKKALAAATGCIKFWPSPPKNCLTTIIAKIEAITGIHNGTCVGNISPIINPVTIGLKSVKNLVFLTNLFHSISIINADKVDATNILTASFP